MKFKYILTALIITCTFLQSFAQSGKIIGIISDVTNGDVLVGVNVLLEGTAIGAATDLDGMYRMASVPAGDYILSVIYIGYKSKNIPVSVSEGKITEQNVELELDILQGESIEVTALLEGQARAINQQINANTIVNVVSSDKIQELPDQNAAESLGRLPGISIQRSGGEGQKVVVRGIEPRFNSITVNGERIPATDAEDRSVDLTMISPDLLEGIEVFKALTPDKDADAIGGTINFIIQKAKPGFNSTIRFQTGYNNHQDRYGLYKGSASISNRFMDDKMGVLIMGNMQRADRSSDDLNAGYFSKGINTATGDAIIGIGNLNLVDRIETRDRYGATMVLDYDLDKSEFLFSGFFGRTERDELRRRRRYRLEAADQERELRDQQINTMVNSNSLSGKHDLDFLNIDWQTSYSISMLDMPFSHTARFRELSAYKADLNDEKGPTFIPEGAKNNIDETFFKESALDKSEVEDADITARVDIRMPYIMTDNVAGYLKIGGKVRDKSRTRNDSRYWTSFFGINDLGDELGASVFDITADRKVRISNFIDTDESVDNFLDDAYDFGLVLDRGLVNKFSRQYRNFVFQDGQPLYIPDPSIALQNYEVGETIWATYFMTEVNYGSVVTFLPGFRYEKTINDYRNSFGQVSLSEDGKEVGALTDSTGGQNYDEVMPMVHLRVKPLEWFDIRLAVTKAISRPNYFNLIPWQIVNPAERTIQQGNTQLKHTSVWNYDIYFSFYNNLWGLFTLGAFYKEVDNIDYISADKRIIGGELNGYALTEPVNAPKTSTVKGWEVELQTNLRFLPSPLDGIIISANYSGISSETYFPLFVSRTIALNQPPYFQVITKDSSRSGPMPGQADYIANISVGYEKGDFIARVSMTNQGKILEEVGVVEEKDQFTDSFVRWDMALQYKFTREISFFLNLNNISKMSDKAFFGERRFPTRNEIFGWTGDFGIRYVF